MPIIAPHGHSGMTIKQFSRQRLCCLGDDLHRTFGRPAQGVAFLIIDEGHSLERCTQVIDLIADMK
jgi:hypothetical protein